MTDKSRLGRHVIAQVKAEGLTHHLPLNQPQGQDGDGHQGCRRQGLPESAPAATPCRIQNEKGAEDVELVPQIDGRRCQQTRPHEGSARG